MNSSKAFTLIELMVVILIVGILAAVAIPMMHGRIDSAKWTEGKAAMGSIVSGIRAYVAETETAPADNDFLAIGLFPADMDSTYFANGDFAFTSTVINGSLTALTVTCTRNTLTPSAMTLDLNGLWTITVP